MQDSFTRGGNHLIWISAVQSVKDDTKILVTSSENVKIGLREGACVRVKGWIDLTQQRPSIRLPKADPRESAVLCSTKVDWWAD